jgi:hypothetical protein
MPRGDPQGMDIIAVLLGVLTFALLYLLIDGAQRI